MKKPEHHKSPQQELTLFVVGNGKRQATLCEVLGIDVSNLYFDDNIERILDQDVTGIAKAKAQNSTKFFVPIKRNNYQNQSWSANHIPGRTGRKELARIAADIMPEVDGQQLAKPPKNEIHTYLIELFKNIANHDHSYILKAATAIHWDDRLDQNNNSILETDTVDIKVTFKPNGINHLANPTGVNTYNEQFIEMQNEMQSKIPENQRHYFDISKISGGLSLETLVAYGYIQEINGVHLYTDSYDQVYDTVYEALFYAISGISLQKLLQLDQEINSQLYANKFDRSRENEILYQALNISFVKPVADAAVHKFWQTYRQNNTR